MVGDLVRCFAECSGDVGGAKLLRRCELGKDADAQWVEECVNLLATPSNALALGSF